MPLSDQIYRGLNADEIRVLVLHPGLPDQEIECHLEYISLSQNPKYEALSYEWGVQTSTRTVSVNEHLIEVRENLWNALLQLRENYISRVLWIDALCINQRNYLERNHQVGLMGRIYQQATRVCAWLGGADRIRAKETFAFIKNEFRLGGIDSGLYHELGSWEQLFNLCELPYWRRLWIIQEIVLAADVALYWAESVLSWDVFVDVLQGFVTAGIARLQSSPSSTEVFWYTELSYSVPYLLNQQRNQIKKKRGPSSTSIFSLFRKYKDAQCSEKKDKIFGPQFCERMLQRRSPHQLYSQFSSNMYHGRRSSHAISLADFAYNHWCHGGNAAASKRRGRRSIRIPSRAGP